MTTPKAVPESGDAAQTIDTKVVRKLADILKDTGLTEIEVETGGLKIRVARELTAAPAAAVYQPVAAAPAPAAPAAVAAPAVEAAPAVAAGDKVKSPMVGTVYLSSQPGADTFVKVGQSVAEGQTLLIVEAMKTMNPIPSPRAGKIVEILVSDAQPVEFGEPLVIIE
ncbi:MAG: acetyl-CoA carboxylase biotin carboxyl carrier protein [Caulobacter sp.]|nr:acetyl-CoA carboxylase biotin carboxyl carrier protein [Caulobacter sp.]